MYLCTRDTQIDRLRSTAVSSTRLNEMIATTSATRMVVILDCCHSGAFKSGDIAGPVAGRGRYVLASCRAGELANDASQANHASLFTEYLVAGLRGGVTNARAPDHVTLDEVYHYVHAGLTALRKQIPQKRSNGEGSLPIARRTPPPAGPALCLSRTKIELDDLEAGENLPPERVRVLGRPGHRPDWVTHTDAAWVRLVRHPDSFDIHMVPPAGRARATIEVFDKASGEAVVVRITTHARPPTPVSGPDVGAGNSVGDPAKPKVLQDWADSSPAKTRKTETPSAPLANKTSPLATGPHLIVHPWWSGATEPVQLTWVEWADTGNGFAAQGNDSEPRMRPYWLAANRLLDSEKVPGGISQTLAHPLWNLRQVHVDGLGPMWCFVERGRGIRLDENGEPLKEHQFGIAGGCRFGFADFGHPPRDVWRAGAARAWTRADQPSAVDFKVIEALLAGMFNKDQIRLPGTPSENAVLIDHLLAVLPRGVAARWLWSTCLFWSTKRFIGGAPSPDLQAAAFALQVRRLAAVPLGTRPDLVRDRLSPRQRPAFDRLLHEATRAATNQNQVRHVLRDSRAATLPDVLDEMALVIKDLRPIRLQDVPTELLSARGPEVLYEQYPQEPRSGRGRSRSRRASTSCRIRTPLWHRRFSTGWSRHRTPTGRRTGSVCRRPRRAARRGSSRSPGCSSATSEGRSSSGSSPRRARC